MGLLNMMHALDSVNSPRKTKKNNWGEKKYYSSYLTGTQIEEPSDYKNRILLHWSKG